MNRRLFKCSRTFIGDHFNLLDRVDSIFKAFPFKPDELSNNSTPDFWLNPFSKRVREACPDERQCKDPSYSLAKCDRDVWCDMPAQPITCQPGPVLDLVLACSLEAQPTCTVDIRPTKLGVHILVLHSLGSPSSSIVKIIFWASLFPAPCGSSLPN